MKALRLLRFGEALREEDVPEPSPGPGEVVVEVRAAGICHSDAHYRAGSGTVRHLPLTLGHEVMGVVVARGPGADPQALLDRVAVHYLVSCGQCPGCECGEQFCVRGQMVGKDRDGGYAERIVVPAANAVPVPAGVADEQAAILMCSTATAYHALVKARLSAGETVLVLGYGGLGFSVVRLARLLDAARVLAVDVVPAKLEAARAAGAVPIDGRGDVAAQIAEATGGRGADVAIDLAGHPALCTAALRALAPGGRLVLVALNQRPIEFDPYRDVLAAEREIVGCSDHTRAELVQLLGWAAEGRLDLSAAVSRTVSLRADAVNAALDALESGTANLRTVIRTSAGA